MKNQSLQFETCLSVSDYKNSFNKCQAATADALEVAKQEIKTLLPEHATKIITWLEQEHTLEFQEFDSGNPTHASGYWLLTITCQDDDNDYQQLYNDALYS